MGHTAGLLTRNHGSSRLSVLLLPCSMQRRAATTLAAVAAYVLLSVAFSWPLPLYLQTHVTGTIGGDTGVYVWNQWVFRHELLEGRHLPLFTSEIFALSEPANLSLHNYTIFQDIVALPLLQLFDVVTTFNIVYLLMIVLTGVGMFHLAWYVTGRPYESWLAGALFSWCPWMVARGMGHFSLVAAAPLPVFVLLLLRLEKHGRLRDALALGAIVCWAATTDPYYAVYCVMIACVFLTLRTVHVVSRPAEPSAVPRALDALLACIAGFALSIVIRRGGWQFDAFGRHITARGLYTPMLLITVLGLLRLAWPYRRLVWSIDRLTLVKFARVASVAAIVSAVMLSPVLYAVGVRIRDNGLESSVILWRSSTPGIDLVSLFLPNPNHMWAPQSIRDWLTPRPDLYVENVASLPFIALGTLLIALRAGWKPARLWIVLTVGFALLALGPFIHIGGLNTRIPGPWAVARYLPLVRLARSPARMTIVAMLGLSMVFATALCALGDRWPRRRRLLLGVTTVVMLFELFPAPRPLYSATVPRFYERVAQAPEGTRLLELPLGVRDGTSSVGDFTARSQFFQTAHGKPLIGGYLSRVSRRRVQEMHQDPMLDALMMLSEGGTLDSDRAERLINGGPQFLQRTRIGFVVIDTARTSLALREFALRAFRLVRVDGQAPYELYSTGSPTPPSQKHS